MPEIFWCFQLFAVFFAVISFILFVEPSKNQGESNIQNEEISKIRDRSILFLTLSLTTSAFAIILLPFNQHFQALSLIFIASIAVAYVAKNYLTSFLHKKPDFVRYLIIATQLFLINQAYFFADDLKILVDDEISVPNRIFLAISTLFISTALTGCWLNKTNQSNSGIKQENNASNLSKSRIIKQFYSQFDWFRKVLESALIKKSEISLSESKEDSPDLKEKSRIKDFLKLNFSLILLVLSVIGFGFFASKALFLMVWIFSIRVSSGLFEKIFCNSKKNGDFTETKSIPTEKNQPNQSKFLVINNFCLAISMLGIGFVLHNPLIIAVSSIFAAFFAFLKISLNSDQFSNDDSSCNQEFSIFNQIHYGLIKFLQKSQNFFQNFSRSKINQ